MLAPANSLHWYNNNGIGWNLQRENPFFIILLFDVFSAFISLKIYHSIMVAFLLSVVIRFQKSLAEWQLF